MASSFRVGHLEDDKDGVLELLDAKTRLDRIDNDATLPGSKLPPKVLPLRTKTHVVGPTREETVL